MVDGLKMYRNLIVNNVTQRNCKGHGGGGRKKKKSGKNMEYESVHVRKDKVSCYEYC